MYTARLPLSSFVIISCSSRDDMSTKWTEEKKKGEDLNKESSHFTSFACSRFLRIDCLCSSVS